MRGGRFHLRQSRLLSREEHTLEGEHRHQAAAGRKAAPKLASSTFLTVLSFWPHRDHNTTLWPVQMGFCGALEKCKLTRGLEHCI